jgi:hypothetical protein
MMFLEVDFFYEEFSAVKEYWSLEERNLATVSMPYARACDDSRLEGLWHACNSSGVDYTVVLRFTNKPLYEPCGLRFLGPLCEPNSLYKLKK